MIESSSNRPEVRSRAWVARGVVSGLVATAAASAVLLLAYGVALLLASSSANAPFWAQWLWGLTHNVVTADVSHALPLAILIHLAAGLAWAVIYAGVAEPRLRGPGWWRGLLFAPLPALLSLIVFLPALGGGVFGFGLGAGPLPLLGNLILHAVYGVTLGFVYDPAVERVLVELGDAPTQSDIWMLSTQETYLAGGTIVGFLVGALIGAAFGVIYGGGFTWLQPMVGAIFGSAAGALAGSFMGISVAEHGDVS